MRNRFGTSGKSSPVLYDSRDARHKRPFGAISTRDRADVVFLVRSDLSATEVRLVLRRNAHSVVYASKKSAEENGYDAFAFRVYVEIEGSYRYRFELTTPSGASHCGRGADGLAELGDGLPEWRLSVYRSGYVTPDFLKGGLVYQIFVDRFCASGRAPAPRRGKPKAWTEDVDIHDACGNYRADDFYGGDFAGIASKLGYLESLGVTCLYLTPIFESSSNHRYDTADYEKIEPMLGGEPAFAEFMSACAARGIDVVLDGVFNHTGADSVYFNKYRHYPSVGACQGKSSPYYGWYTFYSHPDRYQSWWGCSCVPTVARDAYGYHELIAGESGVIARRMRQGVKGWRLDVVDELSESFVKTIRKRIKSVDADGLVLGEVWEDASAKYSYGEEREYFYGSDLDGVMNYVYKFAIDEYVLTGDAPRFANRVLDIMENYPAQSLDVCFTLVDSHDTIRAINLYSGFDSSRFSEEFLKTYRLTPNEYALGKARLMLASCLQYFLPGVPCVYYGDEAGLQGFKDPLNRRPYPWGREDAELLAHYRLLGKIRTDDRPEFLKRAEIRAKGSAVRISRGRATLVVDAEALTYSIVAPSGKHFGAPSPVPPAA